MFSEMIYVYVLAQGHGLLLTELGKAFVKLSDHFRGTENEHTPLSLFYEDIACDIYALRNKADRKEKERLHARRGLILIEDNSIIPWQEEKVSFPDFGK